MVSVKGAAYVTEAQLREALDAVAHIVAKDVRELIGKIQEMGKSHFELGNAHNLTAEIVDVLRLHIEFLMMKNGGGSVDENGMFNESEEFRQWCGARIVAVKAATPEVEEYTTTEPYIPPTKNEIN